jgi:glycosyltransferase involved in cell wall biosynthesis
MIAYNEADALSGLFKDISLQDYPHNKIEVVFVDSMSTDKTYEMMEKFKETGYGFHCTVYEKKSGEFMECRFDDCPWRCNNKS